MLSKYETKTYTGEGPFNDWVTVFKDGEPIFASACHWAYAYGSSEVLANCVRADKEHLARTLLNTPPFKDALNALKENTGQKDKKKTLAYFDPPRCLP